MLLGSIALLRYRARTHTLASHAHTHMYTIKRPFNRQTHSNTCPEQKEGRSEEEKRRERVKNRDRRKAKEKRERDVLSLVFEPASSSSFAAPLPPPLSAKQCAFFSTSPISSSFACLLQYQSSVKVPNDFLMRERLCKRCCNLT